MVSRSFNHPPRPSGLLHPSPLDPFCPLNISLARFNFAIHLRANHSSFETQRPSLRLPMNREIQVVNFEKKAAEDT